MRIAIYLIHVLSSEWDDYLNSWQFLISLLSNSKERIATSNKSNQKGKNNNMSANGTANHLTDKDLNDKLADLVNDVFDALLEVKTDVEGAVHVVGHKFDEVEKSKSVDYPALFDSFKTTGFQASSFAQAVTIPDLCKFHNLTIILLTQVSIQSQSLSNIGHGSRTAQSIDQPTTLWFPPL